MLITVTFTAILILALRRIARSGHHLPESAPAKGKAVKLAPGSTKYSAKLIQIAELVENSCPGAGWVFEEPNAKQLIDRDEDVFILLNRAGGYRRAKVTKTGLEFCSAKSQSEPKPFFNDEPAVKEIPEQPAPKENYGLIAFEWAEANILSLNDCCNEAIARGKTELTLTAAELPPDKSWPDILKELERNGLREVACTPDGIQIKLSH